MADITLAGQAEYRDPTHISDTWNVDTENLQPSIAENAQGIRTKMYGVDVRELIARWVELTGQIMQLSRSDYRVFNDAINKRVTAVEGEMQDVELAWSLYQQNVAESSDNSAESAALAQLANANANAIEGHTFSTRADLDSFLYQLISQNVAAGYDIPINYIGVAQPTVIVTSWINGITSESIFDVNSTPFSSGPIETVNSKVVFGSLNADGTRDLIVTLPMAYKAPDSNDGYLQVMGNGWWRIINYSDSAGTRTIDIKFT